VNPLCNWLFTSASTLLIVLLGWYLTDRSWSRGSRDPVDGDTADMPTLEPLTARSGSGAAWRSAALAMLVGSCCWRSAAGRRTRRCARRMASSRRSPRR
jgi:p-aminobenzoyl-glutamate transporter AbgT